MRLSSLMSLVRTFSTGCLVFETESQQKWLRKRFGMLHDILRDTWAYQEILKEGYEEGLGKGLEKGLEKGREQRLKDQRQMLVTFVQMHFPNSVELAKQRAETVKDPEVLQRLLLQMVATQTEQQAQQILLTAK